jgi:hypothetical protein
MTSDVLNDKKNHFRGALIQADYVYIVQIKTKMVRM